MVDLERTRAHGEGTLANFSVFAFTIIKVVKMVLRVQTGAASRHGTNPRHLRTESIHRLRCVVAVKFFTLELAVVLREKSRQQKACP